jgi:hypothetical protein
MLITILAMISPHLNSPSSSLPQAYTSLDKAVGGNHVEAFYTLARICFSIGEKAC